MPELSAETSLAERTRPWSVPRVAPVRVLVAMIIALGCVEALWLAVFVDRTLPPLDVAVTGWVVSTRPTALAVAARLVTDAGSPAAMITLLVTTVAVLAWRHRSVWPLAVGAGGLAVLTGLDLGMKSLVARPRPPQAWHAVAAHGWSFPSGHAMFSAGVLLLVVWLLAPRRRWSGRLIVAVAVLLTLAVGASRVVLGVHFPTDVLAGWCLALIADGALLLTVAIVDHRKRHRTDHRRDRRSARRSSADQVAECGLLLGFFLPGDSLLFTAGLFVASRVISTPLWLLCLALAVAAVVGNLAGYSIGRAVGPRLLERPDGRFWRRAWVHRTEEFVARYGTKALLLGRFVPIVRTVITAVAVEGLRSRRAAGSRS